MNRDGLREVAKVWAFLFGVPAVVLAGVLFPDVVGIVLIVVAVLAIVVGIVMATVGAYDDGVRKGKERRRDELLR